MPTSPAPTDASLSRPVLARVHVVLLLVAGTLWLAAVVLVAAGIAPLAPATRNLPELVPAGIALTSILMAWLWARRRVPRRPQTIGRSSAARG